MKKSFLAVILFVSVILSCFTQNGEIAYAQNYGIIEIIEKNYSLCKQNYGVDSDASLMTENYLKLVGTSGDWYTLALNRCGIKEDYDAYLVKVTSYVQNLYAQNGGLDKIKLTDFHRICLAVTSCGGDATDIGGINFLADGTYGSPNFLGQGINGIIFGLIALNSKKYLPPDGSSVNIQDYIRAILGYELDDGGFCLSGKNVDIDITAMALTALAPYYNSEIVYKLPLYGVGTVKNAVDRGLEILSKLQTDDGDFINNGVRSSESPAQVLIALASLGIDSEKDLRFIKNGKTVMDGLMRYRLIDGGFAHCLNGDNGDTAKPDRANSLSAEQALMALGATLRIKEGKRNLYDMREEFLPSERAEISGCIAKIDSLTEYNSSEKIAEYVAVYNALGDNRQYVANYWELSKYAKDKGVELPKEEEIYHTDGDKKIYFDREDCLFLDGLPSKPDSKYYFRLKELEEKLAVCEYFTNIENYKNITKTALSEIKIIIQEIRQINDGINQLRGKPKLREKRQVDTLILRCEKLNKSDLTQITEYESLIKRQISIKILIRKVTCACAIIAVGISLSIVTVLKHKRKRNGNIGE